MSLTRDEIEITIGFLDTQDIDDLAQWMIHVSLWQRYNLTVEKIVKQMNTALASSDKVFAIYERQRDLVIGFAWVVPQGMFGKSPYLKQIGIHPDYAGLGLGQDLLTHIEQYVAGTSRDLFLLVSDFNTRAQNFYQNQGYQQIGIVPAYVLPDVNELIYHKRLEEK